MTLWIPLIYIISLSSVWRINNYNKILSLILSKTSDKDGRRIGSWEWLGIRATFLTIDYSSTVLFLVGFSCKISPSSHSKIRPKLLERVQKQAGQDTIRHWIASSNSTRTNNVTCGTTSAQKERHLTVETVTMLYQNTTHARHTHCQVVLQ